MTTFERFERDIPRLMDELAPSRLPDYLDDMLRQTAGTRQPPAWSSLERWLPVGVLAQTSYMPRVPWRPIALLALLIIGVVAAGLVVAGSSQPAVPAPFGAAGNGVLLYRAPDGAILSVDPDTGDAATIATAADGRGDPIPSRDGRRIAFLPLEPVASPIVVTQIDGSDPVSLAGEYREISFVDWSPNSAELAIVSPVRGLPSITVLQADGSGAMTLPLGREIDQTWYLPDGRLVFMAAAEPGAACRLEVPTNMRNCDLFTVNADGSGFDPVLPWRGFDGIRFHPSPDGTKLVYVLWADGQEGRLHVVDVMTGEDRPIPLEGVDPAYAINRAWFSPDGSSILFDLFEDGGVHWAVVPTSGGLVREIGPAWQGDYSNGYWSPDAFWSPDGMSVLVYDPRGDESSELLRVDPGGADADRRLAIDVPSLPAWQRTTP